MPKLISTPPKYRNHKASDQAVVTLNGKDHYLGPWRSRISRLEYDRLICEWLENGRRLPGGQSLSVRSAIILTPKVASIGSFSSLAHRRSTGGTTRT